MRFLPIQEVLGSKNLIRPTLEILSPDANVYTTALFQPNADIEADSDFVKNADPRDKLKYENFFKLSSEKNVALAVTPEYSTPWEALKTLLENNIFPRSGKIWVVGLESVTSSEFEEFQESNNTRFVIISEFEELDRTSGNFLDPVCYMFMTKNTNGEDVKVLLFQFKTNQMGGDDFERDNLIKGNVIYEITNNELHSITLITLICADTLGMQNIGLMGTRSFIIHIQLNKKPRYPSYADYRKKIFGFGEDSEILCLNWAGNVRCCSEEWNNSSVSAYYFKSNKTLLNDDRIATNHKKGLYYTYWDAHRATAYYFNYKEHIFLYRTTKPWQDLSPYAQRNRSGPEMLNIYNFCEDKSIVEVQSAKDFFEESLIGSNGNFSSLKVLQNNPLDIERLLELTLGKVSSQNWRIPRYNSFFNVEDDEIINRISFAQDLETKAIAHRSKTYSLFGVLVDIIENQNPIFPIQIKNLEGNSFVGLVQEYKHSNLISDDRKDHALLAYLEENPSIQNIHFVYSKITSSLKPLGVDEKRIVLCFKNLQGNIEFYPKMNMLIDVDQDDRDEMTSIDRMY